MYSKKLMVSLLSVAWMTPLAAFGATTIGVMPSYLEGSYGTSTTTRIWYLPAYLDYRGARYDFKATVPYLRVQTQGSVVSGGTVVGGRGGATTTASGLGDIWLKGDYRIPGNSPGTVFLPYVKIKLGTASASQGLGTGQDDVEGGLETDWTVGATTFPFVVVGYRFVGSTPAYPLQDILTYEGGSTFGLGGQRFVTAMFAGHQSEQPGFAAAADAIVAWNYSPSRGMGYEAYLDKGLSSGSPDYGIGIGIQNRF